jgi:hypothetical protein
MKRKIYINEYGPDIPGVKGGRLKGPMASTVTGFMTALQKYRACSDAGDHGSVMVYRDDDGNFRCMFCVWQMARERQTFKTKAQVRAWLKEWLPVQRQRPAA